MERVEYVELEPKIVIKREYIKCPIPKELVTPAKIDAEVKTLLELIKNVKDTTEANKLKMKLLAQIECLEVIGE